MCRVNQIGYIVVDINLGNTKSPHLLRGLAMNYSGDLLVNHMNGDKDNRLSNSRIATATQNAQNSNQIVKSLHGTLSKINEHCGDFSLTLSLFSLSRLFSNTYKRDEHICKFTSTTPLGDQPTTYSIDSPHNILYQWNTQLVNPNLQTPGNNRIICIKCIA